VKEVIIFLMEIVSNPVQWVIELIELAGAV
jgi:hypothetical protein